MPWKIASFIALVFGRAVRTLPQGELGDLLWPELDVPKIDEPEPSTRATYRTEPVSTPPRVEYVTSFRQPSSFVAQPTTPIVETPTPSHLTHTSRLPTPTSEGHTTQTSIRVTSTSPNTIVPTSHSPPPTELSQRHSHADVWRVVGIAVIAVSVVGTTILVVVFFDQWWGFLCDVCGRRKKRQKSGKEELVPDWRRRSWEFRAEDSLPAYPSFGSPPARQIVEEATSQARSPGAEVPHPTTLSDRSNVYPVPTLRENGQRTDMQGSPYGPSRNSVRRLSLSNGMTVHVSQCTLSRSDTQKTTTTEDAYGGLAAE